MNLFRKAATMTEPEITGSEAIRLRVWSRMRRAHLARTASDLQIPLPQLESFAQGTGGLSAAQLQLLAKEFYMNARYDAATDRLVDTGPAPTSMGTPPEPYDPRSNPNYVPHDPNRHYGYAPSGKTDPNVGKPARRPGFA
jgi:hypothetical protein